MNAGLQLDELAFWAYKRLDALNATEVLPLLAESQIRPLLVKEMLIDQAKVQIQCVPQAEKLAHKELPQRYQVTVESVPQMCVQQHRINYQQFDAIAIYQSNAEEFPQTTDKGKLDLAFFLQKYQLYLVVYSLTSTTDIRKLGVSS
ncbi:hypothetical protein WKK05_23550 [Nostoc sp. UHCC 0302]|uniref:hypothetical protein n=1 Tax=Nostoc sp. UHCC 0302 TaxID=3134896 RepID=UPI00311C9EFF